MRLPFPPFRPPTAIKLHSPGHGEKAEEDPHAMSRRLDICSAPFAKLEIYLSAGGGNRSESKGDAAQW